ncbi:hypothetical protein GALL_436560 [mine drainage metagenome]|uniref:Uncharacterized protein n=1 Tax=mine drainage metagenome TaxID=410659 RepID=A0A1J5Q448_9ZZZZ
MTQRGHGEHRLEATPPSAGARERRGSTGEVVALVDDGEVPDLAGRVGVPGQEHPVDDDPRADALADREDQETVTARAAVGVLAERARVGVVGDVHGDTEPGRQQAREREVVPRSVGCLDDDAVPIDHPGGPDTDPDHGTRRCGEELARELGEQVHRAVSRTAVERHRPAYDDAADEGHHRPADPRVVGEVDRDDLVVLGPHPDEGRGLADPALGADPELLDESLADQLGDEVRHRHPGQPGAARQVGS